MCDRSQRYKRLTLLNLKLILLWSAFFAASVGNIAVGQTNPISSAATIPGHFRNNSEFEDEVWAKVGERTCLRCHNRHGEAKESEFVLEKTDESSNDFAILARNQDAFHTMAMILIGDQSVLLQKVVGGLDHGGDKVLMPDSTGFKILERFVMRTLSPTSEPISEVAAGVYKPTPFFEAVTMLTPPRLLRRVTLSLAGRLPSESQPAEAKYERRGEVAALLKSEV